MKWSSVSAQSVELGRGSPLFGSWLVQSASSCTSGLVVAMEDDMRKGLFAALLLFEVMASAVRGETSYVANVRAGRRTAEMICAPCHVVAGDQKQEPLLRPPAQSFAEIARGPKADEWKLQTFLASTHSSISHPANMPNPQLSEEQIRDVTAYILSLRERKRGGETRKQSN